MELVPIQSAHFEASLSPLGLNANDIALEW